MLTRIPYSIPVGASYLVAAFLSCVLVGSITAQEDKKRAAIDAVFADWKDRQGKLKSVRYVLSGTVEYKVDKLPPGSPTRPLRYVLLLDLVKNRYWMEGSEEKLYAIRSRDEEPPKPPDYRTPEPVSREYRRHLTTSAYDGETLQHLTHLSSNRIEGDHPDLTIGKGKLGPGAQFGSELWPLFFAHGIVPTVHAPLLVDKPPLSHDPDDFAVLGNQVLDGQNCLLVRTEPLSGGMGTIADEFWINRNQQSTIQRLVNYSGSDPWIRLDVSWKNTAYGWWVAQWTQVQYVGKKVQEVRHVRMESIEANPAITDGDFTLAAQPGMKVEVSEPPPPGKGLNPHLAASRTYLVLSSGAWEEIAAKGFTTLEGKKLPPESRWNWSTWIAGCGVLIGVCVLFALRGRLKKAISLRNVR